VYLQGDAFSVGQYFPIKCIFLDMLYFQNSWNKNMLFILPKQQQ